MRGASVRTSGYPNILIQPKKRILVYSVLTGSLEEENWVLTGTMARRLRKLNSSEGTLEYADVYTSRSNVV